LHFDSEWAEQYKKCIKYIHTVDNGRFKDNSSLFQLYEFLCNYKLGHKLQAYKKFEKILMDGIHLISSRHSLILDDDSLNDLINKYSNKKDIKELHAELNRETKIEESFIKQAVD
jgi:hypothetical protein